MDMLKKAQKKAMAAVKEIQSIVATPAQQQQSYQQSYQQNQQYLQYQYQNVTAHNSQFGQQLQQQHYSSPTTQSYQTQYFPPQPSGSPQTNQVYSPLGIVPQTSPQKYQQAYSTPSQAPQPYESPQSHHQAYAASPPASTSAGMPFQGHQQAYTTPPQAPQSYGTTQSYEQACTTSPQMPQSYGPQGHPQTSSAPPSAPQSYGTLQSPQSSYSASPQAPSGTLQSPQPAYSPPPQAPTGTIHQNHQQAYSPPQVPIGNRPQKYQQAYSPSPQAPTMTSQSPQLAYSPPPQVLNGNFPPNYQQATPPQVPTGIHPQNYQQVNSPSPQVLISSGTPQEPQPAYSPPPHPPTSTVTPQTTQSAHFPPPRAPSRSETPQFSQPVYSPLPQPPPNPEPLETSQSTYSPQTEVVHASNPAQTPIPQHSSPPPAPLQLSGASESPPIYHQPYSPPSQVISTSTPVQAPIPQYSSTPPTASELSGISQSPPTYHQPYSPTSQTPISQYSSPPPALQGKLRAPFYSDSHPQLLREDSGLIAVTPEEMQQQPFFSAVAPSPLAIRKRRTKCSGFEGTLTDIVQFFELKAVVVKAHNLPSYSEGRCLAICEYCFYSIIAPHPWFANCFELRAKGAPPEDKAYPQIFFDKIIGCGLAFPGIRQIIINQTISRNSIQPFIGYVRLDSELPPCSGGPSTGGYYSSRTIEEIAMCRSCFECYIRGTSFEKEFSLMYMPQLDQQWICDIGYSGYIQRTLLADVAKDPPDFSHFASEARKRLQMPTCTGEGEPMALSGPTSSSCFRSVADNCGVFCSSCFYDIIAGSPAEKDFGFLIDIEDQNLKVSLACDLAEGVSKYAMSLAVHAGKFDVWHRPIVAKGQQPLCPSVAGKDEAELMVANPPQIWYHFKDYPEIEICPRCYGMNVCMLQATELFSPITRPLKAERIRLCYLSPVKEFSHSFDPMDYENTTEWRGNYLRNALTYGRDAGGDFTVARQVAKHIASLPPACGSELRKFKQGSGRRFFGHQAAKPNDLNDCTLIMCEECHLYSVKGTPLESFLSNDLTALTFSEPEGHRCSTWSKQCKRRLRIACETQNFASYARWHHKRDDVYTRLWAVMNDLKPMYAELKNHTARIQSETEMNIQMGGLRLMQQMNAQTNATIMGIGGSVAEAAASETGYRHGNSTVGMEYLTSAGANAAQAHHNAANMPGVNFQPQPNWANVSLETLTADVKRKMAIQEELRKEWAIVD